MSNICNGNFCETFILEILTVTVVDVIPSGQMSRTNSKLALGRVVFFDCTNFLIEKHKKIKETSMISAKLSYHY